ncbi:transposase [Rhizobium leguminosarum]|nr:transposase [Rhizobium leguminosarum]
MGDGHQLYPDGTGFVYLCAVVNWFGRRVLLWKLSITLETAFCIEAVEEALSRYGKPKIFNTDQGSQSTSLEFIMLLKDADIGISMDGKSLARQRLRREVRRSMKYEEVYLVGSVGSGRHWALSGIL